MQRRDFLRLSVGAAAATMPGRAPFDAVHPISKSDLCALTAAAAIEAMRRGDMSAESYAATLLTRCQSLSSLNAFISLEPERVLESARDADLLRRSGKALRLLHGLPLPVKDSINSAELPTSAGTSALSPVGLEFDMLPGQDRELLSLGLSVEQVLGPIKAPPTKRLIDLDA